MLTARENRLSADYQGSCGWGGGAVVRGILPMCVYLCVYSEFQSRERETMRAPADHSLRTGLRAEGGPAHSRLG